MRFSLTFFDSFAYKSHVFIIFNKLSRTLITLSNTRHMGSRYLLYIISLLSFFWRIGVQIELSGHDVIIYNIACVGGIIRSEDLFNTNPTIPPGLRDKGRWVETGGLEFSDRSFQAVISGFENTTTSYAIQFLIGDGNNKKVYNYLITAPVVADDFTIAYNGSTDPVLMTTDYPLQSLTVSADNPPADVTNYSYRYTNVETGDVTVASAASPSSTWAFNPPLQGNSDQGIYSANSLVTHTVSGIACRSETNSIEISKNLTLQVVGGGSVCDASGPFELEAIPYSTAFDYKWFLNGSTTGISTGRTYLVDLNNPAQLGSYIVRAYKSGTNEVVAESAPVVVGAHTLSAGLTSSAPGFCEGGSVDLTGTGTNNDATSPANLDYRWVRNGVAEGLTSGGSPSISVPRTVAEGGEFVFRVQESNNPLCYTASPPLVVEMTIPVASRPVTGSTPACENTGISDIELTNSEVGVTYRLMRDGVAVQSWISTFEGENHIFDPVFDVGSYTVEATGCSGVVPMTGGPFVISAFPTAYTINSTSPACVGTSLVLDGLEADVTYYLLKDGLRTGAYIEGSAGAIEFGGLSAGLYTVEGEREGCVRRMNGSLRIQATPQQFTLSANKNSYCSGVANTGVELSLNGSQSGIKYQLQRDDGLGYEDFGTAVDGTNGALMSAWQNVPEGTYRVVARTSAGCTN